jgi:hypothetical protein
VANPSGKGERRRVWVQRKSSPANLRFSPNQVKPLSGWAAILAILNNGIPRFGVVKSEFRRTKSERNPKSPSIAPIRPPSAVSPHKPGLPRNTATEDGARATAGRCLSAFWCSRDCLTRQPIDAGFGLRTSVFFRHLDFGFVQSLISPRLSIHDGSIQNENCCWMAVSRRCLFRDSSFGVIGRLCVFCFLQNLRPLFQLGVRVE